MAFTASDVKALREKNRRWHDGLQKSTRWSLTAIWIRQ